MKPTPEVEAAWAGCEAEWDNAARHDKLFELTAQHDCFAYAAGKYKTRAGDPIADRALERIRKAATAKLMATATTREGSARTPYRATMAFLIFLMVAAIAGLGYVASMRKHSPLPPPPPTPANR
jgi:hypothetical protein